MLDIERKYIYRKSKNTFPEQIKPKDILGMYHISF